MMFQGCVVFSEQIIMSVETTMVTVSTYVTIPEAPSRVAVDPATD